jgi:DNA-binding response OmpR family regulator
MNMQKHNILVVDDEKNILKVVSATLKKENYAVDTAQSSEEAIERFNKNGYDLVISDLKLPGKSGVELLGVHRFEELRRPRHRDHCLQDHRERRQAMKKGHSTILPNR